MAQKFAEYTHKCPRVASLILCNTFTDTAVFNNHESAAIFWMLPGLVLKRMLMSNFGAEKVDPEMVEAIDFMVERVRPHLDRLKCFILTLFAVRKSSTNRTCK
mgnify:FL=1